MFRIHKHLSNETVKSVTSLQICPVIVATYSQTKKKICNKQQIEDKHPPNSAADKEKRDRQLS